MFDSTKFLHVYMLAYHEPFISLTTTFVCDIAKADEMDPLPPLLPPSPLERVSQGEQT